MDELPTLDAHAHIDPKHSSEALAGSGAALAMTLSLAEAEKVVDRLEPFVSWGVGCHPRRSEAQVDFDIDKFIELAGRAAFVGEIGLDRGSSVPLDLQLRNFRQILAALADLPCLVSIHSYQATGLLLEELRRNPIPFPVLHWWTGSAAETTQAVELGCYFSIHSAVARQSKFRTRVPLERILLESDHAYGDPPAAIRCRLEWVEHLVAQQRNLSVAQVRRLVWRNLARILESSQTIGRFPCLWRRCLKATRLEVYQPVWESFGSMR